MARTLVTGVGAANMDIHGAIAAAFVPRDSNPGSIRVSPGGVTRNVLENLSRMGGRTLLLTAAGDDALSERMLSETAAAGVDVSQVLRLSGRSCSAYIALVDESGDMFAAVSDMRILQDLTPEALADKRPLLRGSAAVTSDPCLPAETLDWLTSGVLEGVPLFADPVSTAYARRLRPFAHRYFCLKPNVMELSALTGLEVQSDEDIRRAAAALLDAGTGRVVVSMGSRGCYWADRDGEDFFAALRPVKHMTDATGAGDAFMAGLLYGHVNGLTPLAAARRALAAGVVAVTSGGTVSPGMSGALIQKILEENEN